MTTVREEAWRLEGQNQQCNVYFNDETSMSKQVVGQPRYIPWWTIADKKPNLIRDVEHLVKFYAAQVS